MANVTTWTSNTTHYAGTVLLVRLRVNQDTLASRILGKWPFNTTKSRELSNKLSTQAHLTSPPGMFGAARGAGETLREGSDTGQARAEVRR